MTPCLKPTLRFHILFTPNKLQTPFPCQNIWEGFKRPQTKRGLAQRKKALRPSFARSKNLGAPLHPNPAHGGSAKPRRTRRTALGIGDASVGFQQAPSLKGSVRELPWNRPGEGIESEFCWFPMSSFGGPKRVTTLDFRLPWASEMPLASCRANAARTAAALETGEPDSWSQYFDGFGGGGIKVNTWSPLTYRLRGDLGEILRSARQTHGPTGSEVAPNGFT